MLCPQCNGEVTSMETISQPKVTFRRRKCKVCGLRFFTKEVVASNDEAQPLFTEWSRERARKSRANARGEQYEPRFADGREQKVEPKQPTSPLF